MNLVIKKTANGKCLNKTSVFPCWLALFMAVYMGFTAVAAVFMPCQKEISCSTTDCPAKSSHGHVKPCKLIKIFTISEKHPDNSPVKKMMPFTTYPSVFLFYAELLKNAGYATASKYIKPHGTSPSIFLLKSSFLF